MLDAEAHLDAAPSSASERLVRLRSHPNLAGVDAESLALFAENARDRHFEPGELLSREGKPTSSIQMVLEGRVRVSREGRQTALVERHGAVGFITLLAGDPIGVTAEALAPTRTMEVPRETLFEAYEESFGLLRNNLRQSARFILRLRGGLPRVPTGEEVPLGSWRDGELSHVERMLLVRRGIFADAHVDAAAALARAAEEVRYAPGDILWRAGEETAFNLRIEYGRVRCEAPDGSVARVGGDFVLGAMDLLGGQPRSFTAVAETDVIASRAPQELFLAILETHPQLAIGLAGVLSRTLFTLQLERAASPSDT